MKWKDVAEACYLEYCKVQGQKESSPLIDFAELGKHNQEKWEKAARTAILTWQKGLQKITSNSNLKTQEEAELLVVGAPES